MRAPSFLNQLALAAVAGLAAGFALTRFEAPAPERRSKAGSGESGPRRGGAATSPTEIPPGGWGDILWRTYEEVGRDRVLAVAAGVTFYGLLALFPAVTAFVSLYGLVADPATVTEQLAAGEGLLPGGALDVIRDQVSRIASGGGTVLGFAFVISLALSAWSANAGVKAIFDALNVAYGEEEKRSFIWLNLTSLAFTLGMLVFAIVAIGAIAALPVLLDYVHLGETAEWVLSLARWPLLAIVLMLGLSVLYRFGPSRDSPQWRWVSPGAVFAAAAWLIGSALFSWYVANFEDYNETYGTLGAVVALMMWLWLSATIILIGAELNSESERQTFRDTTRGPPTPIGTRGADAADNKG